MQRSINWVLEFYARDEFPPVNPIDTKGFKTSAAFIKDYFKDATVDKPSLTLYQFGGNKKQCRAYMDDQERKRQNGFNLRKKIYIVWCKNF